MIGPPCVLDVVCIRVRAAGVVRVLRRAGGLLGGPLVHRPMAGRGLEGRALLVGA